MLESLINLGDSDYHINSKEACTMSSLRQNIGHKQFQMKFNINHKQRRNIHPQSKLMNNIYLELLVKLLIYPIMLEYIHILLPIQMEIFLNKMQVIIYLSNFIMLIYK
ncbi:unnamed protein product [Paramecium sonneborni]|uniref:Uncharacterized protein n=1 Tax=Paramecium sonneborni TaxID=65129 RepID=A0A8S1QNX4_9CILI|nr:unnamed protein product [Paramecium sonneborni]